MIECCNTDKPVCRQSRRGSRQACASPLNRACAKNPIQLRKKKDCLHHDELEPLCIVPRAFADLCIVPSERPRCSSSAAPSGHIRCHHLGRRPAASAHRRRTTLQATKTRADRRTTRDSMQTGIRHRSSRRSRNRRTRAVLPRKPSSSASRCRFPRAG